MSNNLIVNNVRTRGNGRRAPLDWAGNGFVQVGWNKWQYPQVGKMPGAVIAPGVLNGKTGLVAKMGQMEILWPYGTDPAIIKGDLDGLALVRHDNEEIDLDQFMADLPQEEPARWVNNA